MDPNHIVFIVMDSCPYDSFVAAQTPSIDRIGAAEKRYSYASWTVPSHHAFTMGMMPHASPKNVYASEVYKEEFLQWKARTGSDAVSFKDFLPELSLPRVLDKRDAHHHADAEAGKGVHQDHAFPSPAPRRRAAVFNRSGPVRAACR